MHFGGKRVNNHIPTTPPEKRPRGDGLLQGAMQQFAAMSTHQLHPQLHPIPQQTSDGLQHPVPGLESARTKMVHPGRKVMYRVEQILGKGSFGVVYKAIVSSTNQYVAIKAVKQRAGEGNVEDMVLRRLRGSPNIVAVLGAFPSGRGEDHTLNIVLEYISDTLQRIIKHHRHLAMFMDMHYVRLYMYQLLRGLASLERHRIVHRDLKPANLLVDPATYTLKICDFGTAKLLGSERADNQPYVCSRYYRAPELILSAPDYGTAVDLWSAGCVLAEMLVGQPLFAGRDGVDQLSQIVEILGTPSQDEFRAMNPQFDSSVGFRTRIEPLTWDKVLRRRVGAEAAELLGRLLQYNPSLRPPALEAMTSALFRALRQSAGQLDPALFNLSEEELAGASPQAREDLLSASVAVQQSFAGW